METSASKDSSAIEDFGIDYAPAIESTSLLNIKEKYGLFIDGDILDSSSSNSFKTLRQTNLHFYSLQNQLDLSKIQNYRLLLLNTLDNFYFLKDSFLKF